MQKKVAFVAAFLVAVVGSSAVTTLFIRPRESRADQVGPSLPPPFADDWQISSYFSGDSKLPTNGFVVINRRTGKVSNCVANWMGQKEGRCYDWSSWVRLPR
jgi:hypothetical protein